MAKNQIQKIFLVFLCVFVFAPIAGCGKAHFKIIKEATELSKYKEIYVLNTVVSSDEQEEKQKALNEEFAQFSKDEIVKALTQKSKYRLIEGISLSPDALLVETSIHIIYGSRALRYWVGFGAGKGSVVINMKLKESSSSEIKLELESKSNLSVGAFGGSMDKVIKNSIKKIVSQFVKKL